MDALVNAAFWLIIIAIWVAMAVGYGLNFVKLVKERSDQEWGRRFVRIIGVFFPVIGVFAGYF